MSNHIRTMKPALRCLRQSQTCATSTRSFATSAVRLEEAGLEPISSSPPPPPTQLDTQAAKVQQQPVKAAEDPVVPRRQRGAPPTSKILRQPFQCYQEALKVIQTDREEKLRQIKVQQERIAKAKAQEMPEALRRKRLSPMEKHLEKLKVLTDINDPSIKRRFEEGRGTMDRPVYRYLADRKWRSYEREILMQRLTQMNIAPDVLPKLDPIVAVNLSFGTPKRRVPAGDFVDSLMSASAPSLKIQAFDKHVRTVTLAVIDSDIPDPASDSFTYRCHFLAANIPLTAMAPNVDLSALATEQIILPWLPPHAQKGSPYHRLSVFVLEQEGTLDLEAVQRSVKARHGFNLRSFNDKHKLKAVGAQVFRTQWDQNTAMVMKEAGLEGAEVEFVRRKPESLPWSAKIKDGARYR